MRCPTLLAVGTGLLVVVGSGLGVRPDNVHNGLLALSFALVGTCVLRRRPSQREAELFLVAGAAEGIVFLGRQVGTDSAFAVRGWAQWVAWLGIWPLPLVLVVVGATVMCFPDGQFPGAGWRRAWQASAVVATVLALLSAFWPVDYGRAGVVTGHPLDVPGGAVAGPVFAIVQPIAFTSFQVLWLVCVAARYRRADALDRRQLRWVVGAVGVSVVVLGAGLVLEGSPRAGLLTVWLIPVAAGIAIVEAAYERMVLEVRSAASRVVTAQDDARRRFEQDLHDGAQHRLVVLGMELGRLVDLAERAGDEALVAAAAAARDELLAATSDLRALARGLHPAVLTRDGLEAALVSLAEYSTVPVRIRTDLARRCPPAVETSAYFVVGEALTNAARHSGATRVEVDLVLDASVLHLTVSDDGCGGAMPAGGLIGLADRVRSGGGRLEFDSPAGAGTRVRVELPCP
jgi:signal transduction histidine kinase